MIIIKFINLFSSIKDIYELLEITIYDEDPNKKIEFLGKITIPLLKVIRIF